MCRTFSLTLTTIAYTSGYPCFEWGKLFLPPANEVWGKVIFLHLFVILFTGGGTRGCWGRVWLLGGMHGSGGHAWLPGGMHGCKGACVVARGCVWLQGACVVVGGVHGCRGCAWLSGDVHRI